MTSEVFRVRLRGGMNNTVLAGRICALVLLTSNCNTMMGDTMESEHNQICECPLLDELEMPNASLQAGHTAGIVGT